MNEKLLKANGRNVRLNGVNYHIISLKLGNKVLADAEPLKGTRINLVKTSSDLGLSIRNLVDKELFV